MPAPTVSVHSKSRLAPAGLHTVRHNRRRRIGQQRAELRGRGDGGHGDRLEHDEIPARYRLALEHNPSINAGARGNWLNHRADGAAGAAKFAGSEVCGKTITALSGSATAQA
ncbi:hypothetical protein [Burkholderia cenocepacia]|uniref:hypothetical protein n=1 Tax=Burkholderia cenocepacia TaxID=95486 RepID=UPI002858EA98|nr:hypothetical protein [Burkholderia cenocepacia]MDR5664849.1 hypothetical protein [Burkholderia cenocepacia]MDR8099137.1 hypothetical protein [Burkholderia cenocepacia]